jgi:hypothetical protein
MPTRDDLHIERLGLRPGPRRALERTGATFSIPAFAS